ncbi:MULTISPECIES: hypothetical protein [unclassified Nocardioides]|uniref:hypothetical protein n=1 Tax=unclassified Nocardioides TaxID=2615069 RepID=UPI0036220067
MTTDTTEAPTVGAPEETAPPRRRHWLPLVAAVVVLAAVASAVWTGLEVRDERAADERGRAALAAGRVAATAFTSYDHRHIDEDLDRVAAISTGTFREEFTKALGALTGAIREAGGISRGEVTQIGVVRQTSRAAVVIAAVDATITNKATRTPSQRRYRLEITLTRVGDDWLISDISPVA